MRRYLIAGNWKMNKTIQKACELVNGLATESKNINDVDIAVFPPFTALYEVYKITKETNIDLGAQNLWYETKGAYTGEISPEFIVDVGCKYVIVGHSERRKYFQEKDELINRKTKLAIEKNLIPIVCVGETLEQRENGETRKVIEYKINELENIDFSKIVLAYEPLWAIGTGKTATPEVAEEAHKFIRDLVQTKYGSEVASNIRILYGGSVKPDNVKILMNQPDIDGALVGGASLDVNSFMGIIKGSISL